MNMEQHSFNMNSPKAFEYHVLATHSFSKTVGQHGLVAGDGLSLGLGYLLHDLGGLLHTWWLPFLGSRGHLGRQASGMDTTLGKPSGHSWFATLGARLGHTASTATPSWYTWVEHCMARYPPIGGAGSTLVTLAAGLALGMVQQMARWKHLECLGSWIATYVGSALAGQCVVSKAQRLLPENDMHSMAPNIVDFINGNIISVLCFIMTIIKHQEISLQDFST